MPHHTTIDERGPGPSAPSTEPARIRRMFADIAPTYDLLNRALSLRTDVAWRRKVFRELRLPPDAWVLDVCTGTADLALAADRSDPRPARVIGADFTPEMVRLGEQKRRRLEASRLALLVADTLRLPFRDECFDAVTVAFGVRNLSDRVGGFREMCRVLRPGGRVAILEFSAARRTLLRRCFDVYFHRVLPRVGGWMSGSAEGRAAYEYLPRSVGAFPPPQELSEELMGAGFTGVRHLVMTLGVVVLHLGSRPERPVEEEDLK